MPRLNFTQMVPRLSFWLGAKKCGLSVTANSSQVVSFPDCIFPCLVVWAQDYKPGPLGSTPSDCRCFVSLPYTINWCFMSFCQLQELCALIFGVSAISPTHILLTSCAIMSTQPKIVFWYILRQASKHPSNWACLFYNRGEVKGCFFHFAQALNWRTSALGLLLRRHFIFWSIVAPQDQVSESR